MGTSYILRESLMSRQYFIDMDTGKVYLKEFSTLFERSLCGSYYHWQRVKSFLPDIKDLTPISEDEGAFLEFL